MPDERSTSAPADLTPVQRPESGENGSPGPAPRPEPVATRSRRRFRIDRYGTIIFLLVFIGVIGILEGSKFLSWTNISLVLANNSPQIILAAAVSLTLIAGQFDLSVGYLAGLAAMLTAIFARDGMATGLIIPIVLFVGMLAGTVNAMLVTKARVNAFIATLGMGGVFAGMTLWLGNGTTVFGSIPQVLTDAGNQSLGSVPLPIVFVVIVAVVVWALVYGTVAGRLVYATGANPEAARLAGVPTTRVTILAFIATSLLATIAGILLVSRLGAADPSTGTDLLLPAFAAAFLGASILSDGRFTPIGAMLGGALVVISTNGLQVAGVNFAAEPIFNGVVLVAAVALTEELRRRRQRGPRRADAGASAAVGRD